MMKILFKSTIAKYFFILAILAVKVDTFSQVIREQVLVNEPFAKILQSPDDAMIYVGTKANSNSYANDVTLTKKDMNGGIFWKKNIEMDFNCSVNDAAVLSDGHIIIVGGARASTYQSNSFVLKTDSNGDALWTRYYHAGRQAEMVIENHNGGYLFAYYSEGSHLMKIDSDGDSIWAQRVGVGRPHGLAETSEAVYLMVDDHNSDIVLSSIGSAGEVMWKLNFGGPGIDRPAAVLNDMFNGDNYVIAGTYSNGESDDDFYVGLIDCFGYTKWIKTFGGPGTDLCYQLTQASDGDFLAVGTSNSYSTNGKFQFYVLKIDINGNVVWEKTFTGDDHVDYHATDAFETSYGSLVLAGSKSHDSGNMREAYLFEFINPTQLNISIESDKQVLTSPPYRVEFTNNTPFMEYLDFVWDFGDGESIHSNDNTIIHEYKEVGLFDVKLIASASDFGSIDSVVLESYINCRVDVTTSIGTEAVRLSEPKVQPNPFNNKTMISFDNPDHDLFSLRIIDQNGRILQEINNLRGSSVEINRKNLPPGLHFVELTGKKTRVAKIVIE
jgi:hypothetical protein